MRTVSSTTKIFAIIGDPIEHSLSPKMHNAGYKYLGVNGKYVFVAARVTESNLGKAIDGIRALGIAGVSCTKPHKTHIIRYLDDMDDIALRIGAVNTVMNDSGRLKGFNTDWLGIVGPLEKKLSLKGKRAAILGAGGTARAASFGLSHKGVTVKIFNRTAERAKSLADEVGADYGKIEDLSEIGKFDILINTTSVGMSPESTASPVPKEFLKPGQVVFDAVYFPYETKLLREARNRGAAIIHGTEMLLYQGMAQFEMFTGERAPEVAMRKALEEELNRD